MNVSDVKVRSNGFSLWKKMESERGRVTLQEIAEETGLNLSTVRKFLAVPNAEIAGATLSYVWIMAQYLGVGIEELVSGDVLVFERKKVGTE